MFELNGFTTEKIKEHQLQARKKHFSLGMCFVGLGLGVIGFFIYILYFIFLKKAEIVTVTV